jgi:hypothetical protein
LGIRDAHGRCAARRARRRPRVVDTLGVAVGAPAPRLAAREHVVASARGPCTVIGAKAASRRAAPRSPMRRLAHALDFDR